MKNILSNVTFLFFIQNSFSVSYFGHKAGAHDSLLDHLSAIVLGAAETVNCQTYFPRCGAAKKS